MDNQRAIDFLNKVIKKSKFERKVNVLLDIQNYEASGKLVKKLINQGLTYGSSAEIITFNGVLSPERKERYALLEHLMYQVIDLIQNLKRNELFIIVTNNKQFRDILIESIKRGAKFLVISNSEFLLENDLWESIDIKTIMENKRDYDEVRRIFDSKKLNDKIFEKIYLKKMPKYGDYFMKYDKLKKVFEQKYQDAISQYRMEFEYSRFQNKYCEFGRNCKYFNCYHKHPGQICRNVNCGGFRNKKSKCFNRHPLLPGPVICRGLDRCFNYFCEKKHSDTRNPLCIKSIRGLYCNVPKCYIENIHNPYIHKKKCLIYGRNDKCCKIFVCHQLCRNRNCNKAHLL